MRSRWFRLGFVAGFVLGTKAGRERYEEMRRAVQRLRSTSFARSLERKVRERLGELQFDRARGGNGAYAPAGYDAELANLRGPGAQP